MLTADGRRTELHECTETMEEKWGRAADSLLSVDVRQWLNWQRHTHPCRHCSLAYSWCAITFSGFLTHAKFLWWFSFSLLSLVLAWWPRNAKMWLSGTAPLVQQDKISIKMLLLHYQDVDKEKDQFTKHDKTKKKLGKHYDKDLKKKNRLRIK